MGVPHKKKIIIIFQAYLLKLEAYPKTKNKYRSGFFESEVSAKTSRRHRILHAVRKSTSKVNQYFPPLFNFPRLHVLAGTLD